MYLGIGLLFVAVFVPGSSCYENIHEFMSPEEVQHLFHTDVDSVPEYEVVKIHVSQRLHKRGLRSRRNLQLKAFGGDINLWMHPADSMLAGVDTPVYYAKFSQSAPGGVEYRHQPGLMGMVGRMYEDPRRIASFVIGTDDTGRTRINGYVESHGLVVRSLPQRVVEEYRRRRRSDDDPEHPQHSPYHIVIKMNETTKAEPSNSLVNETRNGERVSRSVEAVPATLYPEILVVVEHSVFATFMTPRGHDIYGLLEYLLAFWNGVDLKYRSLDEPKFRLHISAILLAEDDSVTSYIANHRWSSTVITANGAVNAARTFFYQVKELSPLKSYDIAVTLTSSKIGKNANILGQSYPGSACQKNDAAKIFEAVAICHDNGLFKGVHVTAHELGHIFGSLDDLSSGNCFREEGFVMAGQPLMTTNSSDFSSCSIARIQKGLDDQKLTCLYNRPQNAGARLPKPFPGRLKNLEAQCRKLTGGSPCRKEGSTESVCVNMFCWNEQGECESTGIAALDGSQCGGENEFCLHQQCVRL